MRQADERLHAIARLAHKYVPAGPATLDRSPDDFAATIHVAEFGYPSRAAYLADDPLWMRETRTALEQLLTRDRTILSVGSGHCHHEVRLTLAGYTVTASDLFPLNHVAALFAELPTRVVDVLAATAGSYDDVVAVGVDYALDDRQFAVMLGNLRELLRPGGRLILGLAYTDNPATRLIDRWLHPWWARRHGLAVRKPHGYRRSRREVRAAASRAGFRPGRTVYAGHAMELTRVGLHLANLRLFEVARRIDRRVHLLNNVTVFEFHR